MFDHLRAQIAVLDDKIHTQLASVDVLHLALQSAESAYFSLKHERQLCLDRLNQLVLTNRKLVALPTEVMLHTWSYLTPGSKDFTSAVEVWGDVVHKAVPCTLQFRQLQCQAAQESLAKCSRVRITDHVVDQPATDQILTMLDQPEPQSLGLSRWRELSLRIPYWKSAHEDFLKIIQACGPHLSNLLRLKVVQGPWGGRIKAWDSVRHTCSGCLKDNVAPGCPELILPLSFLPCFRNVNRGRIRHLDADLTDIHPSSFTSYFNGFDVENLQTITLRRGHGSSSLIDRLKSQEVPRAKLVAPNLRSITTHIENSVLSGAIFFALLDRIQCETLESLEIHDEFYYPYQSLHQCHRNQPPWISLNDIGRRYPCLKRLSLCLKMQPAQSAVNLQFISNLFKELQTHSPDKGKLILPQLGHLAIPYSWNHLKLETGLDEVVRSRARARAPLHSIELFIEPEITLDPAQQLDIDQLGLHVRSVFLTRKSLEGKRNL